ncbi:hypothetical protein JY98_19320 [Exiguobacterium mexicanum]|nr:hypothetical protein JY98_19320 [Exiguobacterium mexicanum]
MLIFIVAIQSLFFYKKFTFMTVYGARGKKNEFILKIVVTSREWESWLSYNIGKFCRFDYG